jgi:hypothetical protein
VEAGVPYTIKLKELPCGYAATSARKGETVTVQTTGFASSEDGDLFIRWLDGVSDGFLSKLPARIPESTIDNLFVILRADRTATIYVNEATLIYEAKVKRAIEAGERIMKDDIADIGKLKPKNVEMPPDAGLLVVLSAGWRKGLFFDYRALPDGEPRSYDIEAKLGAVFAYLLFQDRLKITDEQWKELLRQRWYPFVSLSGALTESILSHVRERWEIDDLLDKVIREAKGRCAHLRANAARNPLLGACRNTPPRSAALPV